MKKTRFISAALLVALLSVTAASAQTVEELIAKNIAAKGGAATLQEVQSLKQTGQVVMMGMEIPVVIYQKRPHRMRTEMEMQGMKIVSGFDGEVGWMENPMMGDGAQKLEGEQSVQLKRQADLDGMLVDFEEKGFAIEYAGEGTVGDKKAYKLAVVDPDGNKSVLFLDADTYLELKVEADGTNPMSGANVKVETFFDDYRDVNGRLMPFVMEIKMDGQTFQKVQFSKIELNGTVDDALFAFPGK